MKKDFALALNEVLEEKQLPREIIVNALESAMISAYRKTVVASSAQLIKAEFDLESGKVQIFVEKEVVEDVLDDRTEVTLERALEFDPECTLGDIVVVESTPENFGRVAAQTARQVIQQKIRDAERQSQFEHFQTMEGEVVNGIIQAMGGIGLTIGLDRKAEGIMPRSHQIQGERFRLHDRVRALLLEVKQTPRGPQLILSRAHRNFLRRLLEDEVPEIYHGQIEIRSIAREPGYRSKVAVAALQPGIDPVGACVGIRGVRIQAIVRELHDEKIDVIEWNPDPNTFIARALSPARVTGVFLNETNSSRTATVVVPEDQLSLAIGRSGQNARLAAKLTSWKIDIKSLPEATSESLFKLQNDPEYAKQADELAELVEDVEVVLGKKEAGRAISPEEYKLLGKIVNLVETGAEDRRQVEIQKRIAALEEAKSKIPEGSFDTPLDELGLSPRLSINLTGFGYSSIGDLMLQLDQNEDEILSQEGVGPKAMEDIKATIAAFDFSTLIQEVAEIIEEVATVEEIVTEEVEPVSDVGIASKTEAASEVIETEESAPETIPETPKTKPAKETPYKLSEDEENLLKMESDSKKKPKKKKYRALEYDPDQDVTIVRKRRKGDEDEWNNKY
jgi:transcription termination/antitermination protein NusA